MRGHWVALALIAAMSSARAGEATAEGARGIEDAYAAYFGRRAIAAGILAAAPDGEAYVISWDLEKAARELGAPADTLKMAPFTYRLKPEADGGWSWSSLAFPKISLKTGEGDALSNAEIGFDGFSMAGRWDPTHEPFLVTELALGAVSGDVSESGGPYRPTRAHFVENDLALETRAQTNAAGGVDLAMAQSVGKVTESISPADGQGSDGEVTLQSDFAPGGAAIAGLRAREIGALWRATVSAAESGAGVGGLVALMARALPLWNEMRADVRLQNIKIASEFGGAEIAGFGETVKLSGLNEEGRVEFGVDIDGLVFQPGVPTPWIAPLTPLSAKFAFALTDGGVGKAARIALADPKFGEKFQVSPEGEAAMNAAILDGDPRMVLLPGRLTNPMFDLAFEGSARLRPGAVSAEMKISVDSLDKALGIVSDFGGFGGVRHATLVLGLLKGLAKTQADGRLFWDVVIEGPKVTVNGSPMPESP